MARAALLAGAVACASLSCKGDPGGPGPSGQDGPAGPTGSPGPAGPSGQDGQDGEDGVVGTPAVLGKYESLPGVVPTITRVVGGTGPNGTLQPGDRPEVTFTLTRKDGKRLLLSELDSASILLSGPTSQYQLVIPSKSDVKTLAVENADGSYTYTFAAGLPAQYPKQLNDTDGFVQAGELRLTPLRPGTYTVGLQLSRNYSVEGTVIRDAGYAVFNVGVLGDTALEARQVVAGDNCNQCHVKVQAHGGGRNDVRACVLCHTAGAEDRNTLTVAGGTPNVSIDFGPMVHRIHNASKLPSVLGVGTHPDGTRNYSATPAPYQMLGFGDRLIDFSSFAFPSMPSAYSAFLWDQAGTTYSGVGGNGPTPKDVGFGALAPAQRLLEDRMRTAGVSCIECHGDPDGAGPLLAPAQGGQHETTLSRKACGSCHDDIDWSRPYTANGFTMPAQADDTQCAGCHTASGTPLSVRDAHGHPYSNRSLNTGVNVVLSSVAGGTGTGGTHQAGDPMDVSFTLKDDAGSDLDVFRVLRFQWMVTGPTSNPQMVVPTIAPFDNGFRKGTPFTGSGAISGLSIPPGATAQTVAVVLTGPSTFDLYGTISAPVTGQALSGTPGTATVTYGGVTFTLTAGATAFAANDRFYLEVVPRAASYTVRLPFDVALERAGLATGGADVLAVGNPPLRWGRQTVFERTALQAGAPLADRAAAMQRSVVADAAALAGVAAGDRVVLGDGTAVEEYATVGWVETVDPRTGADLGTRDRLWFSSPLRFEHPAGGMIQEVTLSSRREGSAYSVNADGSGITTVAGGFTAGNPVVISYRTDARFGYRRGPGDALQAVFQAAAADSEDLGAEWGDWKGLSLLGGTYTVGTWANRDFTVRPNGQLAGATEAWNNFTSDNTTYRMISPPATTLFLYGNATAIAPRAVIQDGKACDTCHGDLQAHGNGRRGYDTCMNCHGLPGMEDGPKSTFPTWYVGPTPGAGMEFRSLIHKIHAGKELAKGDLFEVNGVFLGVPYRVKYDEIGFPDMPGGVKDCAKCHGATSTAWKEPAARAHPEAGPVRAWKVACASCHDSDAANAHIELNTYVGWESCAVCHGPGRDQAVEIAHKVR